MRIRRASRLTETSSKPAWRAALRAGLALAILAASALWYAFEGREIVRPWFQGPARLGRALADGLPTLYLELGARGLARLDAQARAASQAGGIREGEPVAARVRFEEQRLSAAVRPAEGPVAQPETNRRSFTVALSDGAALLGMPAFSAAPTDAASFLNDWWYAQALREAGLPTTHPTLVHLAVDGEDWGLYLLRDAFTETWLAAQGRGGRAVVRPDTRVFWDGQVPPDPVARAFDPPTFAPVGEGRALPVGASRAGGGETQAALALLCAFQEGRVPASQAFDAEQLGRTLALANLWGARHGLLWESARYVYDPSTARLAPIGHDARALSPEYASRVDLAQYDDPAVMEAYAREVARISQPGYLASLRAAHTQEAAQYEAALPVGERAAYAPWELLAQRQALLQAALHPAQTVRAYEQGRAPDGAWVVQVDNLLPYPVILQEVRIGGRALAVEPGWIVDGADRVYPDAGGAVILRSARETVPRQLVLRVPADALASLPRPVSSNLGPAQIVTRLVGMDEQALADVQPAGRPEILGDRAPAAPSLREALERHPFLEPSERPGFLALKAGTWAVDGDLVLPEGMGLEAEGPVTLSFAPGALLYASGPLRLHGSEQDGIHLVPQTAPWAGLIVYRAGPEAPSLLRYVEIRGAQGAPWQDGGTGGGATFYESPVECVHCRLADSTAQDTLRVVRARFEVLQTEFGGASGDAIDAERALGRVEGCAFHDVLGNGIEARQSRVDVQASTFARVYDRAISAGEGSLVSVRDLRVSDAGLVLASRDASHLEARDVQVEQIRAAGLAAYGQEPRVQASLRATNFCAEDEPPILALVQPGSRVTVDGAAVAPSPFDAAALDWRAPTLSGVRMVGYHFGDQIRLLGYTLDASGVSSGAPARLVLYWQGLAEIDREYTVFVHALDASGQFVTQWDAMPRENEYPTTHWLAGRVVDDPHSLAFPPGLAAGSYQLAVGLYFWQTGERLPLEDLDGTPVPNGMLFLEPRIEIG